MDREQLNAPRELTAEEIEIVAGGRLLINGNNTEVPQPSIKGNLANTPAINEGLATPKDHGAYFGYPN